MARLIFDSVTITDGSNTILISGIVTDSITMTEEALQVAIEDNQNINEGYTTTLSFRTRDLIDNASASIVNSASTNNLVYAGGSNELQKVDITMNGVNGGNDYTISGVYVMGRRVFENGRDEVEISCQVDSHSTKISIAAAS